MLQHSQPCLWACPIKELLGTPIENYSRNKSADNVNQVVRFDIYRGATEEEVEGEHRCAQPFAEAEEENHEYGAHTDM
jgi:hypothetical protein